LATAIPPVQNEIVHATMNRQGVGLQSILCLDP
jgi:hypothetical protein